MTNHAIEIDPEIFQLLQREARPFLDTPNDVLRRLLLSPTSAIPKQSPPPPAPTPVTPMRTSTVTSADPKAFVREILSREFGAGFKRRRPYRMMYEDAERLVYFQNFSKEAAHLWYRITANPWKELKSSRKNAWICFTNPVERYAYLIPVADIKERAHHSGWSRDYLEVNVDPGSSRWTELNWDVSEFRKLFGRAV